MILACDWIGSGGGRGYLVVLACDWIGSGSRCGSFSLLAAETRLWTFLEGLIKYRHGSLQHTYTTGLYISQIKYRTIINIKYEAIYLCLVFSKIQNL